MQRHLKALGLALLVAAACVGVIYSYFHKIDKMDQERPNLVAVASLADLQFQQKDQVIAGSSLKGKAVIVNFWASWCSPCLEEIPSLVKLVQKYKGQLVLLAISEDDNEDDISAFRKSFPDFKTGDGIEIVFDPNRQWMKKFDVQKLPESFVFKPNQGFERKVVGSINWFNDDAISYVAGVLGLK